MARTELLSPHGDDDERRVEDADEVGLRPQSLDDFVGQDELKSHLRVMLEAARRREHSMGHLLFAGPPGLGKTTLVNILTGRHAELAPHAAGHMDVDAVWSFSSTNLSSVIEREAAGNLKRTWVNNGVRSAGWDDPQTEAFLAASTEVKTVWVPYGE